jgi:hypothetical protein
MIIEIKLDFKRYLRLMFSLTYRKPLIIFLTIIGLMMFIGSILYFLGLNVPFDRPPYFQIILGFIIVGIIPFSIYRSTRKNFSSEGRLQEKTIYEFTDDRIKITGETFSLEMTWTKVYKIIELKEWILIYHNKLVANIIPKESFGEDLSDFKNLLTNKNINIKLKK